MTELKPCPFCGNNAKLEHNLGVDTHPISSFIRCNNTACGAEGKVFVANCRYSADEEAIEWWNRRANNDHTD